MKRFTAIIISVLMLIALVPAAAFADDPAAAPADVIAPAPTDVVTTPQSVTITTANSTSIAKGTTAYLTVTAQSSTDAPYKLVLEPQDNVITIKDGNSGIITSTEKHSTIYEIACVQGAEVGEHKIKITAVAANSDTVLQEYYAKINVQTQANYNDAIGPTETNVSYTLSGGDAIYAEEINALTVYFYNRSNTMLKNAEISLTLPAGMSIESGAAAIYVGNLGVNKSVKASFPVICDEDIKEGSYMITAVCKGSYVQYIGEDSVLTEKTIEEAFYVPVKNGDYQEEEETSDVARPILMVSNYSSGGNVVAGRNFNLKLTLLNTSKVKLQNIKVTLSTGGNFVPVGSSNSFYVESIPAGETIEKTITLSSSRDTAQGMYPITVNMSYEDTKQASFTSSDDVSVSVTQEMRLVIDDILDPGWLTMSDTGYASISYRNMGNNTINNVTITIEGDFDMESSPTYFVGNMASGKQDSYSFNFYPHQAGPCVGKATFVYEDADGREHSVVKEFTFNIGEGYQWEDDPGQWEEPVPEGFVMPTWGWALIGLAAIILIIVIVKVIKKRKAKKLEALDLDE